MAEIADVWKQAVPTVQSQVTGRGVWAALNAAVPVALEDSVFVLGLPHQDSELAGHLRIPATVRIIETIVSRVVGTSTRVRVIDGTTQADYEVVKRRDAERRRLQEAEMAKMRTELEKSYEEGRKKAAELPKTISSASSHDLQAGLQEYVNSVMKTYENLSKRGEALFVELTKTVNQNPVVKRMTEAGEKASDDAVALISRGQKVAQRAQDRAHLAPFQQLTPRERTVLAALADGESVADIAARAVVSVATVRTQVRAMPKPATDSMFEHVYATPHAVVDGEREAFARYEASFLDTEEAHR